MPYVVDQGSPTATVTLTGFNFVRSSRVYLDNQPLPTKVISRTELQATVDATILAKAAKYALTVKNPAPIAPFEWGDTSNQANLLVPYKFTTQHSHNKF
jgi:IPT/TIG domain